MSLLRTIALTILLAGIAVPAWAEAPRLDTVFPPGAAAGATTQLVLTGAGLQGMRALRSSIPGATSKVEGADRVALTVPPATAPGLYEVWTTGPSGISNLRRFVVSRRRELTESVGDIPVQPSLVVNGRLDKAAEVDAVRFRADAGRRVLLEGWAERIESRLRAVMEVEDARGKVLATNRGYFGIDPLIDFRAPSAGEYTVRVHDLTGGGGPEYYYRLSLEMGPRPLFTVPAAIPRGKASKVTLYGWNLATGKTASGGLESVEVEIPAARAKAEWPLPLSFNGSQAGIEAFAYTYPGADVPLMIGVSDVPVALGPTGTSSRTSPQSLTVPVEVSGRLNSADQVDWYALSARQGEVFTFDVLGQRIGSPMDPQLAVLNAAGVELSRFADDGRNLGGVTVPTAHADPIGRWVAPADGRYLLTLRDVTSGATDDPRRVYRLRVRRDVPDFELIAVPRRDEPSALNVARGGSEALDVVAIRKGGMNSPIRIVAGPLPPGVECADAWLGPGVDRTTMTLRVEKGVSFEAGELALEGIAEGVGRRSVRASTVVRGGMPAGWGRLASTLPFGVAGESPLRVEADTHVLLEHHLYGTLRPRHAPGSVVDVTVRLERAASAPAGPVRLTLLGAPESLTAPSLLLPPGATSACLSFYLPPGTPRGAYSLVARAETVSSDGVRRADSVTAYSSPAVFQVEPEYFRVEVDPFVPVRARRGETIQIGYGIKRLNGFIGKVHTELAAPGVITDVPGLRVRGETFVGQSDKGSLQLIIDPNAPLGRQRFLRLFSVGVVEDEPVYQGAVFLDLEVVE